jgi:hypothetical protein
MWVRLKTIYYMEEKGRNVSKRPGDWVNVHKSAAMMLIARGQAEIPSYTDQPESVIAQNQAGVVVVGETEIPEHMFDSIVGLAVKNSPVPAIIFQYNLIWTPSLPLRVELLPTAMHLLDTWEIIVPMWDYNELAAGIGSEEDRAKVKATVRDLRVPLYDTRMMFVRKTDSTERLFAEYVKELSAGMEDKLAFLLALYRVKPFIMPTPLTWTGRSG